MIFKLAVGNMTKSIKKTILSILILTLTLVLLIFSLLSYTGMNRAYETLDVTLRNGAESCGMIKLKNADATNEKLTSYYCDLIKNGTVDSIGTYDLYGGTESLSELRTIQENYFNNAKQTDSGLKSTQLITVNYSLINLCKLNVTEGKEFDGIDTSDGLSHLYLGYNFMPYVKLGTTYTDSDNNMTFVVDGFLKKNSYWVSDISNGFNMQETDYSYMLDDSVIWLESDEYLNTDMIMFSVGDGKVTESDIDSITKSAENYGLKVAVQSVTSVYNAERGDASILQDYLLKILIVVAFSAVVVISCMQVSFIINDKKSYGIYYVIGLSRSEITAVIFVEALIKTVISILLSCCIGILIAGWWFNNGNLGDVLNEIYWKSTMPYVAIGAFGLMTVSSIAPICVIRNYTPVDLMGGKND